MRKSIVVDLILTVLLSLSGARAYGAAFYKPALDVAAPPISGFAREANDGNWLYTLAWAPATLVPSNSWAPTLHAGIIQGWRTNKGDPMTGVLAGASIRPVALLVQGANAALSVDQTWKPLAYIANATYIDTFAGYRLTHGSDVHSIAYGVNFELRLKFGNDDLKAGL